MSLEQEAGKNLYEEEQAAKAIGDFEAEQETTPVGGSKIDLSFLMAKTGEGNIENYIDHPLNFSRSRGLAQILRGVTGMVGEMDLAIVDICIGTFNMMKEGKVDATDIDR